MFHCILRNFPADGHIWADDHGAQHVLVHPAVLRQITLASHNLSTELAPRSSDGGHTLFWGQTRVHNEGYRRVRWWSVLVPHPGRGGRVVGVRVGLGEWRWCHGWSKLHQIGTWQLQGTVVIDMDRNSARCAGVAKQGSPQGPWCMLAASSVGHHGAPPRRRARPIYFIGACSQS